MQALVVGQIVPLSRPVPWDTFRLLEPASWLQEGLNKDGDCTYHHCTVLQIRANPYKPMDTRFPAEKK